MAADATEVQERCTETLNACAGGTLSTTIAPNYYDRNATAIARAVREAALAIGRAILANPKHVHRNLFVPLSPTSLTHAGELPDMAGEGDLIEIQPYSGADWVVGTPKDVQKIEDYRANPGNIYGTLSHVTQSSPLSGFHQLANGRFYFTGFAARGYFPVISRSTILTLIPDEYEGDWFMLAIGLCEKIEDNSAPTCRYYGKIGLANLPAITNMSVLQKVPPIERAIQARGDA